VTKRGLFVLILLCNVQPVSCFCLEPKQTEAADSQADTDDVTEEGFVTTHDRHKLAFARWEVGTTPFLIPIAAFTFVGLRKLSRPEQNPNVLRSAQPRPIRSSERSLYDYGRKPSDTVVATQENSAASVRRRFTDPSY
jgi:hypothetical protein